MSENASQNRHIIIYIVEGFSDHGCIVQLQQVCQADITSEQKQTKNIDCTPINKVSGLRPTRSSYKWSVCFLSSHSYRWAPEIIGNSNPTVTNISYRFTRPCKHTQKPVNQAFRAFHARHMGRDFRGNLLVSQFIISVYLTWDALQLVQFGADSVGRWMVVLGEDK